MNESRLYENSTEQFENRETQELMERLEHLPHLSDEERMQVRVTTKVEVKDPQYSWGGQKSKLASFETYANAKRQLASKLKFAAKESNGSPVPETTVEDLVVQAKDHMVGFWGERMSCAIPFEKADTIYAGSGISPNEFSDKTRIEDISKRFGGTRKDHIIITYYLSQLEQGGHLEKALKSVDPERTLDVDSARQVLGYMQEITADNKSAVEAWQQQVRTRNTPSLDTLYKWTVDNKIKELGPVAVEFANNSWEAAKLMINHNSKTPEAELQELLFGMYNNVTLPDALLINESLTSSGERLQTVDGFVEVKTYTAEEITAWVEALELGKNESGSLQTEVTLDGRKMNFGLNIAGENQFVNIAANMDPAYLSYSPEGGYTGLLRFTADIPEELLTRLGREIERQGYKNIVIQKIPISLDEIKEVARVMVKRDLENRNGTDPANNQQLDTRDFKEVLPRLTQRETWE